MPSYLASQIRTNRKTSKKKNTETSKKNPNENEIMPGDPAFTVGGDGTASSKTFVPPILRPGPSAQAIMTPGPSRARIPSQAEVCTSADGLHRSHRRPSAMAAKAASERDFRRKRSETGIVRGLARPSESARDRAVRKYSSTHGGSQGGVSTDGSSSSASPGGEGCGLVRGAASPSESARNRSVSNYRMGQWVEGVNSALDKVDGNSVTRGDTLRPRRVVTEPAKVPTSSFLDPMRYAYVRPGKGSPYGEATPPRSSSSESVTRTDSRASGVSRQKSHASRFLDRM